MSAWESLIDGRWLPLSAVLAAAIAAVVADRAARLRRPHGDRGDYWTRVALLVCAILGLSTLLSGWLEPLWPQYWSSGRHLHLDLTGAFGWLEPIAYWVALSLPFGVWLLLLVLLVALPPAEPGSARWLAGGVGFAGSRTWVLWLVLPLVVILAATVDRLGLGAGGYPAATWATLAVLALSLVGVALSAGKRPQESRPEPVPEAATPPSLPPWPEALAARGLKLSTLVSWPASPPARPARGAAAELAERLNAAGARFLAPELIEAVAALLEPAHPNGEHGPIRVVFAPDDCGQAEGVALAAERLEQRIHTVTLVVTARDANTLASRLGRWLPRRDQAHAVRRISDIPAEALIWVVDAEFLSDQLLPLLKNPTEVRRIGMVVWWHLQDYTGVMGANLWAISRRLHRLIRVQGRHDVRTLALIRSAPHGHAQLAGFVRRLLPHPLQSDDEVYVEPRLIRTVSVHRLESQQDFFQRAEGRNVAEQIRHLPLTAARVSAQAGWPTFLELPENVSRSELEAFRQQPLGGAVLGEQLCGERSGAGACLLQVRDAEVLSLPEIISQGGRASREGLPHHVGLCAAENPYVNHLLGRLGADAAAVRSTSRRLVCAEAHPSIIRRHLLLALNELPDTRSGLLRNALWEEEIIQKTLDKLAFEGKLTRREVRSLRDDGRLEREAEYKSQSIPGNERRPLDTVGMSLIEVREPAGGYEAEGVRMRLDPERLTIKAYPRRVFMHAGQRYRVRDWSSPQAVCRQGWLHCEREGICTRTWRIRNSFVFGLKPLGAEVAIGRQAKFLTRLAVDLKYGEEVVGVLDAIPMLGRDEPPRYQKSYFDPITQDFDTRALALLFPELGEPLALTSLCQALRHVLPVHLGVEEDALELVALSGEDVDGREAFGVAIVDLYPGGIGLMDAIRDDSTLILQLLEWTRDWLAACPCRDPQGCERCLLSAAALAANDDQPPQRAAALALLQQIV